MLSALALVFATAWAVAVTDTIIESTQAGSSKLVVFGNTLGSLGTSAVVWILCILAASAGLALAFAWGNVRERRLERRMSAQMDERLVAMAQRETGLEGRGQLLSWRVAELRAQVAELTARRDELKRELGEGEIREDRLVGVGLHRRPDPDPSVVVVPEVQGSREPS
jgi:hypothetical protein